MRLRKNNQRNVTVHLWNLLPEADASLFLIVRLAFLIPSPDKQSLLPSNLPQHSSDINLSDTILSFMIKKSSLWLKILCFPEHVCLAPRPYGMATILLDSTFIVLINAIWTAGTISYMHLDTIYDLIADRKLPSTVLCKQYFLCFLLK